ncbi:MAG: hypothetical protein K2X08_07670 [Chlamydiales bacterium]|nr:hypothetical protein [Chlamydiales bacterium]
MENYVYWSPKQIVTSGKYPLSMGQVRHLLLFRHRNGLQKAVRKIGKRLMLRVDLFDQWIEKQASQRQSAPE